MKKIEEKMVSAVRNKALFFEGNTMVTYDKDMDLSDIYLYGSLIATYCHKTCDLDVDINTLADWPTLTTKSRLRALGADVTTKNHTTYLNGVAVD